MQYCQIQILGEDLTAYNGLASQVSAYVSKIRVDGIG